MIPAFKTGAIVRVDVQRVRDGVGMSECHDTLRAHEL
jgi:hypothetical protein